MIQVQDSKKKILSIGQYKVISILLSNPNKDIFQVQDLKDKNRVYTLRILKSNQNPKQIDTEIEILNLLNSYKETLTFHKLEIFTDKLLFIFDYARGENLQERYTHNKFFYEKTDIKFFIKSMLNILEIYKQNNILHNNISPENIIFDGKKYYLIGYSKATIDKNLDQTSDYYALISVIYFLLSGKSLDIQLNLSLSQKREFTKKIWKNILASQNITLKELQNYMNQK